MRQKHFFIRQGAKIYLRLQGMTLADAIRISERVLVAKMIFL